MLLPWTDSWHRARGPMKWQSGSEPLSWMPPTMRCPLSLLLLHSSACSQAGKEKDAVVALLRKLAPLYNKLYDAAKAALVPLPGGRPYLRPCAPPDWCCCYIRATLLASLRRCNLCVSPLTLSLASPACAPPAAALPPEAAAAVVARHAARGPAACLACLCHMPAADPDALHCFLQPRQWPP